jgi:hypothetical protein
MAAPSAAAPGSEASAEALQPFLATQASQAPLGAALSRQWGAPQSGAPHGQQIVLPCTAVGPRRPQGRAGGPLQLAGGGLMGFPYPLPMMPMGAAGGGILTPNFGPLPGVGGGHAFALPTALPPPGVLRGQSVSACTADEEVGGGGAGGRGQGARAWQGGSGTLRRPPTRGLNVRPGRVRPPPGRRPCPLPPPPLLGAVQVDHPGDHAPRGAPGRPLPALQRHHPRGLGAGVCGGEGGGGRGAGVWLTPWSCQCDTRTHPSQMAQAVAECHKKNRLRKPDAVRDVTSKILRTASMIHQHNTRQTGGRRRGGA